MNAEQLVKKINDFCRENGLSRPSVEIRPADPGVTILGNSFIRHGPNYMAEIQITFSAILEEGKKEAE